MSNVTTISRGQLARLSDPPAAQSTRRHRGCTSTGVHGALGCMRCEDVTPAGADDQFEDELAERLRASFAGEDEMFEEEGRISRIAERLPSYSEFPSEEEPRTGVVLRTLTAEAGDEERARRDSESAWDEVELEGRRQRAQTRVCVIRPRPKSA